MIEKLAQTIEIYSKDEVFNILKEFNNIALNIYNFINKYSLRSGYIHINQSGLFFDIYLADKKEFSLNTKEMFEIININKWEIYLLEIAFYSEIKLTILVKWFSI